MSKREDNMVKVVTKGAMTLSGLALIILSIIASPFVLWMIGGDDEGSSWSLGSIIVLIIVICVFVGGVSLLSVASKRKRDEEELKPEDLKIKCECGATNPSDAKFCNKCGKSLKQ